MDNIMLKAVDHGQIYGLVLLSEFLGTALLILLGNGVCAATSYSKMFANKSGKWICIAFGWGLAVFLGALLGTSLGGPGHLNPAVTIMDVISTAGKSTIPDTSFYYHGSKALNVSLQGSFAITFILFLIMQMAGAMFGQMVINFMNTKFIKDSENDIFTLRGAHCTAPAYSNKEDKATIYNFTYEFVGTLVLVGLILAFGHSNVTGGVSLGAVSGIPVTFLIISIGLSLGSATGYAINPVRDLGPRIIFATMIKKMRRESYEIDAANWGYAWVPVVAPMLAGVVIGLFGLI